MDWNFSFLRTFLGIAVVLDQVSAAKADEVSARVGVRVFVDQNNSLRNSLPKVRVSQWYAFNQSQQILSRLCRTGYSGSYDAVFPNFMQRVGLSDFFSH